jgi:zinc/manganese transport system substrate-binding protein
MFRKLLTLGSVVGLLIAPAGVEAKLKVVASTSDLAYFTRQVGGDLVEVEAIAPPTADVHYVEVRPSYMLKVSHADLAVKVGLELDMWMDRIIDGSRNNHLTIVDCAKYIHPVDVPTFKADARYGDLHRFGNPHYWLTPDNVAPITQAILEGLANVDPGHAEQYGQNRDAFLAQLEKEIPKLRERAAPLKGMAYISYHSSWAYFNAFTGMEVAGHIEPYPGVAPSPSHVAELIDLVKKRGITLIAVEPYFDHRVPDKIGSETGARVVTLYPSIGGRNKGESYTEFLMANIDALIGGRP